LTGLRGNVTSSVWHVTLHDPYDTSSHSGEERCKLLHPVTCFTLLYCTMFTCCLRWL